MSGGHHHSPLHNMSPACHQILDMKKLHMFHFDVWQTDYIRHFEPIMPPGWRVSAVEPQAIPHGRKVDPPEQTGIMMTFLGPSLVQHRRNSVHDYEGFMLWMMPRPYGGRLMKDFAHFPSQLLGYTPTHAIYEYQISTTVPSWRNWKKELIKLLRLSLNPKTTSSH